MTPASNNASSSRNHRGPPQPPPQPSTRGQTFGSGGRATTTTAPPPPPSAKSGGDAVSSEAAASTAPPPPPPPRYHMTAGAENTRRPPAPPVATPPRQRAVKVDSGDASPAAITSHRTTRSTTNDSAASSAGGNGQSISSSSPVKKPQQQRQQRQVGVAPPSSSVSVSLRQPLLAGSNGEIKSDSRLPSTSTLPGQDCHSYDGHQGADDYEEDREMDGGCEDDIAIYREEEYDDQPQPTSGRDRGQAQPHRGSSSHSQAQQSQQQDRHQHHRIATEEDATDDEAAPMQDTGLNDHYRGSGGDERYHHHHPHQQFHHHHSHHPMNMQDDEDEDDQVPDDHYEGTAVASETRGADRMGADDEDDEEDDDDTEVHGSQHGSNSAGSPGSKSVALSAGGGVVPARDRRQRRRQASGSDRSSGASRQSVKTEAGEIDPPVEPAESVRGEEDGPTIEGADDLGEAPAAHGEEGDDSGRTADEQSHPGDRDEAAGLEGVEEPPVDDDETSGGAHDLRMDDEDNRSHGDDDEAVGINEEPDATGVVEGDIDYDGTQSPEGGRSGRFGGCDGDSSAGDRTRAASTGSRDGGVSGNRHSAGGGNGSSSVKRSSSGGPQIASYVPLQGGPFDTRRVFVGRLLKGITADVLQRHFSAYGKIEKILLPEDPATGRSKGFAFITFVDPLSLKKVLTSPQVIDGVEVDCKPAFPKDSCHGSLEGSGLVPMGTLFKTRKLFVCGLAPSVTSNVMRKYFSRYGTVVDCRIIFERSTKQSKCYGFCEFANESSVDRAMRDYKIHTIAGKWVQIKRAMPQPPNGGSNNNVVALTHAASSQANGGSGSTSGDRSIQGPQGDVRGDRRGSTGGGGASSPGSGIHGGIPEPMHPGADGPYRGDSGGHRIASDPRSGPMRSSRQGGLPGLPPRGPHHSMPPMMPPTLPGRGSLLGPGDRYYGPIPGPSHDAYYHSETGGYMYIPPHPAMGYAMPPMMPPGSGGRRSMSGGRPPADYGIVGGMRPPPMYRGESPSRGGRMHYPTPPPAHYYETMPPTRGSGSSSHRRERSACMDPGSDVEVAGWPAFGALPPVHRSEIGSRLPFFAESPVAYPAPPRSGKRKASWSPHPGPDRSGGRGDRSDEDDETGGVSDGQGGPTVPAVDGSRRTVRHSGGNGGGTPGNAVPSGRGNGGHAGGGNYHGSRSDRNAHQQQSTNYSMAAMASSSSGRDHRGGGAANAVAAAAHADMYYRRRRTMSPPSDAGGPIPGGGMDRRMMYGIPPDGMPPMYSHAGMMRPDLGLPPPHPMRDEPPDAESMHIPMLDPSVMTRGRPTHSTATSPPSNGPNNRNKRRRVERPSTGTTPGSQNGAGANMTRQPAPATR